MGFQLGGGLGATFFGCPESPDISHAFTRPPNFNPNKVKVVYLRCTAGDIDATSALAPKIVPLDLSLKKFGDDIASGDWNHLRMTVKRTIRDSAPASAQVIKALREPPRGRKKQKDMKHGGHITLDETANIALPSWHQPLAREPWNQERCWDSPAVGCSVDGRHPNDIIDDISCGAVECWAS